MLSVIGKNVIGYADRASGNLSFFGTRASDGTSLHQAFTEATAEETNEAVTKAVEAFSVYAQLDLPKRVAFLKGIAQAARDNREVLIRYFCLESGLSEGRASKELERACFQMESYADAVLNGMALEVRIDPEAVNADGAVKPDIRKMNVPLGPVVVFGASNFPFAYSVLGGDVASALAAGCPVIVKGHAMHPHTGECSARIISQVALSMGLPDGVFSYIHASGYEVGAQLVTHPGVKAVGFTGSIRGGLALQKLAQDRPEPIPVFAEMGSSNPIVITQRAFQRNVRAIASQIAASAGLDAGQFCTSPGMLFFTASDLAREFIEVLTAELAQIPPQVMLHPAIFAQYCQQAESRSEGAAVLLSGTAEKGMITPALTMVTGESFLKFPARQEEVFGSFMTIVYCADESEMYNCLHQLHGQLTLSLFAEPEDAADIPFSLLSGFAGRVILNGVPTGVTVSPAMHHGGPFPATNQPYFTAVGPDAVKRFMRPISFQNTPDEWLPDPLKRNNPLGILRFVNGLMTDSPC